MAWLVKHSSSGYFYSQAIYFEVIYTSTKHDGTDAFTNAKNESQDLAPKNVPGISQAIHKCKDKVTHPTSKYSYLQGAMKQPLRLNTTGLFIRRATKLNLSS